MKIMGVDAELVKVSGIALATLGIFGTTWAIVADPSGLPRRSWNNYLAFLGFKLRRMFIFTPPLLIAMAQVVGVFGVITFEVLFGLPYWWAFAIAIVVLPPWAIEYQRKQRVIAIEEQIDGFMLALANALKATPSLGDAFRSIGPIIADPLRQEVELAVKEMRVGSSLDQALLMMAGRVGSRQLDSALSAVLIGRQVGGNLPKILDSTAASLREMRRLEGVVRTKTAEGKMQLWVLAIFPFALAFMINAVSPGYFSILTQNFAGYVVVTLATLFWISSLVVARKILAVDL
jgi:tight adherence protein B